MKTLSVLFAIFLPLSSQAVTWKVVGPCSETPWFQGSYEADLQKSLGDNTIDILNLNKIPYLGVAGGINSINNSPIGLDAMEIVSDIEMRAYGWCVSVNGKVIKDFPSNVSLASQNDEIVWYYGYARNLENQWLGMCYHANKIKADQFCKK
ncbi:MAG: DUF4430 domain-containing protein [Bdellovibrio sp.]